MKSVLHPLFENYLAESVSSIDHLSISIPNLGFLLMISTSSLVLYNSLAL